MTHHPIKVLEDGTRVYSNGTRYTPVPPEQRKHQPRKPPVPGALRMGAVWYEPLVLLPADERLWPETVPDEEAYDHAFKPRKCKCLVCKRPAARKWRRRGLAHKRMGLSNTSSSDEGPPSSR